MKIKILYDQGDLDGYQRLGRVYDNLRKSSKFTAAQNKEKDNSYLSSIGELVDYCEKEGGKIPRYEIKEPYDKIDKIIDDLKQYNKSLIYSDVTLAAQIENYLKKKEILDRQKAEKENNKEPEVTNEDYQEYFDQLEKEIDSDQEIYNGE